MSLAGQAKPNARKWQCARHSGIAKESPSCVIVEDFSAPGRLHPLNQDTFPEEFAIAVRPRFRVFRISFPRKSHI
jgi:hypothetical protein